MQNEVEAFLVIFKEKMRIWDVVFRDDRGKNLQTLVELELKPKDRTHILENLHSSDYSSGPKQDRMYAGADMWIFGVFIKNREVYIKITLGAKGCSVVCISFHISEHPLVYPFK